MSARPVENALDKMIFRKIQVSMLCAQVNYILSCIYLNVGLASPSAKITNSGKTLLVYEP
jgi:hypothetical protein